jgi:glycosyltransferase involved in cell wall biosynthesis
MAHDLGKNIYYYLRYNAGRLLRFFKKIKNFLPYPHLQKKFFSIPITTHNSNIRSHYSTVSNKNSNKVACTIISKNYLPMAFVLGDSFKANNPDWEFKILLCDLFESQEDIQDCLSHSKHEIIPIFSLLNSIDFNLFDMILKYNVIELNTAIKPFFLNSLFLEGYEKVLYFDPDILITDKLFELDNLLDRFDIILTPHITEPIPEDGLKPKELDILLAGSFNLGFIGLKRSSDSQDLVTWWQKRLSEYCYMQVNKGMHVDQNWINFIPCFFDTVHILRSKSYNAAYWNLHERDLKLIGCNYFIDETKLKFFHFSGFQIDNFQSISKHQSRYTLKSRPDVANLFKMYNSLLLQYDAYLFNEKPYAFNSLFPTQEKISPVLRALYQHFPQKNLDENYLLKNISLLHYANEKVFSNPDVSRIWYEIYNQRTDVKTAIPDIENNKINRTQFCRWIQVSGIREHGLSKVFLEPGFESQLLENSRFGINFFGYFNNIFGVAEIGRAVISSLLNTGIALALHPIQSQDHNALSNESYELKKIGKFTCSTNHYSVNLLMVNADQIPHFMRHYGIEKFSNKYNIACWFWEIEGFFPFPESFELVDEIWGFSEFCCNIYKQFTNKPVKKITYPFQPNWGVLQDPLLLRKQLNISEKTVAFIFTFDFHSCFERKNPLGIIDAFTTAFLNDEDASLIIKSIHAEKYPNDAKILEDACRKDKRIQWIDKAMTKEELISLMNACDCYVSLHRSEGFGIGLAEAMYLGKSTIATAYGGNMDFMYDDNSLLVPFVMTPITHEFGPYKIGCQWAAPDLEKAAVYMKLIYENTELRKQMGEKATNCIRTQLNPKKTAEEIQIRISEIDL